MRWLVERRVDVFDDFGADVCEVLPCGALKFYDIPRHETQANVFYLAPGQWISVCQEES